MTPPLDLEVYPARVINVVDEPSYGLLLRTAEHNGAIRPYAVFRKYGADGGHGPTAIDVDEVARTCKADAETLRHATPILSPEKAVVLGEAFDRRQFSCISRRWCPHCLAESPHHRVWWDLVSITTCPFHGVDLVNRCECDAPLRTVVHFIRHCRDGHDLSMVDAPKADQSSLAVDGYLVRRLLKLPQPAIPHLDAASLEEVIQLLEFTGRALLSPTTNLNASRHGGSRSHLLAAGFEAVSDLETEYPAFLDALTVRQTKSRKKWGLEKAYGRYYVTLVRYGEGPLRNALLSAIGRHGNGRVLFKGGQSFAGEEIVPDGKVNLVQAARMCAMPFERFRRILVALDLMPKNWGQGTPFLLAKETVQDLAKRLEGHKDLITLAAELGLGQVAVVKLADEGLLDYVVHGGGNRKGLNKWIFHRDSASTLINQLEALVPKELEVGSHLAAVPRAANTSYSSVSTVIRLLIEGRLRVRGIDRDAAGILRFLVDKGDTQRAVRQERAPGLTQNEVCDRIGLQYKVIASFVQGGIIASTKVGRITSIAEDEVERFLREYITVPALAELTGMRWKDLMRVLSEAGVEPATKRPEFYQMLYNRPRALAVLLGEHADQKAA